MRSSKTSSFKTTPSKGNNETPDRTNTKTKGKKAAFGVPSLFGWRDVELANGSDPQKNKKGQEEDKEQEKSTRNKKAFGRMSASRSFTGTLRKGYDTTFIYLPWCCSFG